MAHLPIAMQQDTTQDMDKDLFMGSLMSSSSVALGVKLMFFNFLQISSLLDWLFQK